MIGVYDYTVIATYLSLLLGLAGLGLLGSLGSFLGRLLLGIFLLGLLLLDGRLGSKDLLHGADRVLLGHVVENHVQFLIGEDLGVGLGLFGVGGENIGNLLGIHTKVCCDLFQTILNKTHSINAPPYDMGVVNCPKGRLTNNYDFYYFFFPFRRFR